ncbi:hypothetical protein [Tannerella sp.]|uniref:hypothetical protein n=1 Tax=Tannerella sp. TaxID=2382127 RepID=UPI003FA211FF
MKIRLLITGLLLLWGIWVSAQEVTKYGIKSAVIKKEVTAMGQKMQNTLYFDDYGKKEATELHIKVTNMEKLMRTIAEGKTNVSIDVEEKKAYRMPAPDEPNNYRNLTQEDRKKYNIREGGEEEIAGKLCKKYTLDIPQGDMKFQATVWIWEGIMLKFESVNEGQVVVTDEAKEIRENEAIPADKFTIPEGFTVHEQK